MPVPRHDARRAELDRHVGQSVEQLAQQLRLAAEDGRDEERPRSARFRRRGRGLENGPGELFALRDPPLRHDLQLIRDQLAQPQARPEARNEDQRAVLQLQVRAGVVEVAMQLHRQHGADEHDRMPQACQRI